MDNEWIIHVFFCPLFLQLTYRIKKEEEEE